MDAYPEGSLGHNVPLLIASGLAVKQPLPELDQALRDDSTRLKSNLPCLDTREAEVLVEYFDAIDTNGKSWAAVSREEIYRLRIKCCERSFSFPMRKARLPDDADEIDKGAMLHSPFSPLSPVSELYPDGLINEQWITKHQDLVPAVFMCFYALTTDPNSATLEDNKLKADINQLKAAISAAGYKTRMAIIFLQTEGDGSSPLITDHLQERLESIRKGTGMDPKSMFYVAPQKTPDDLKSVADSILSNLYGTAIEYYRDLGRHSRKKRSRGIAPQPTVRPTSGTSQTLSLSEWNLRYDFKTAILSEFRQELEPALRSFEQTYDQLLGPDILDVIPNWSRRWNEARLLADIITIRSLRLHLWMGQPSLAVRRWQSHRDRISELVERLGRGTNNYSWQAWEARWALVMAQLIEKIKVPALAASATTIYLQPEKAVLGERLQPWELLHHTGYWYRIAARHLIARRRLAQSLSDDDRTAPIASAKGNTPHGTTYDNYLCPPPYEENPLDGSGTNHSQLIIDCLSAARNHFESRKQQRIAAELALECAKEMAVLGNWQDVLATLRPLWDDIPFRSEEWIIITEGLCWMLRKAAIETNTVDLLVALDWELLHSKFSKNPQWHYDLNKSLDGLFLESRPSVSLSDDSATSVIAADFAFRTKEGKAGESCVAQLSLVSNAVVGSSPLVLSKLKINFEGSLNPILLEHDETIKPSSSGEKMSFLDVTLEEEFDAQAEHELPSRLSGKSNLTINPGERLLFQINIPLRVPGETEAESVTVWYENKAFDLDYTLKFRSTDAALGWFVPGSAKPKKIRKSSRALHIQPRPPKMEIKLAKPLRQFYANERIHLQILLQNEEEEGARVKADLDLLSKAVPSFQIQYNGNTHSSVLESEEEGSITSVSLDMIPSSGSLGFSVFIEPAAAPVLYEMQLRAVYYLDSDPATPITQTFPLNLNLVSAFEANYNLVPRLHTEPWPSLFDHEGLEDELVDEARRRANGLSQKWCLMCHFASFAQVDLRITDTDMQVTSCIGGAQTRVSKTSTLPDGGVVVEPKSMNNAEFDIVVQKLSLDDRQPVSLDLAFIINWKHVDAGNDDPVNTTTMNVGQYLVLGIEPRVLATVIHPPLGKLAPVQLDITVENPSNHMLTFGLSMEPSDEFGFSGAKQTTIHLVPLSRRTVTYRLLPLVRGTYIRPGLHVRDKYFQKLLRIIPTDGMKIDKDGLLLWIPGPNGEGESDDVHNDGVEESK